MTRLKTSCCGLSVKAGTLLLLWIDQILFGGTLGIYVENGESGNWEFDIFVIIILNVELCIINAALLGIYLKKPVMLVPHFFTQIITLMFLGGSFTVLMFLTTVGDMKVIDIFKELDFPDMEIIYQILKIINNFIIVIFAVLFGVQWYFALIVYSYFKKLTEVNLPTEHAAPVVVIPETRSKALDAPKAPLNEPGTSSTSPNTFAIN